MFRRRPSSLMASFHDAADHVERAKEAMVSAMPSARRAGTPLAEALHVFEAEVAAARELMPAWRAGAVEAEWEACAESLRRVAGGAERLRLEAPSLDFEGMAMVLGDLIAPLDAFGDAERAIRALG